MILNKSYRLLDVKNNGYYQKIIFLDILSLAGYLLFIIAFHSLNIKIKHIYFLTFYTCSNGLVISKIVFSRHIYTYIHKFAHTQPNSIPYPAPGIDYKLIKNEN